MNEADSLERDLVLAGLDALRQVQGDAVVRVIVGHAAAQDLADMQGATRVPIVDYLRYRDAALGYLGDTFNTVAFETGRTLVRNLRHKKLEQIQALIARFELGTNKLPLIGQAAVLAVKGNPGVVRATMKEPGRLVITIEKCPECRDLERDKPFCFLNQGIITEFAQRYLGASVKTEETACLAVGDAVCQIEVIEADGSDEHGVKTRTTH